MIITLPNDFQVGLRPAHLGDMNFIYNSWMKQVRTHQPFDKMSPEDFKAHKVKVIDPILESCNVIMAHDPESENVDWGYVVFNGDVCHFVYVKGDFRDKGFGKALMSAAFEDFQKKTVYCTHLAQSFKKLREPWKLCWDPYRCSI